MDILKSKKEKLENINFQIGEIQEKINSFPITTFVLNKEIADLMAKFQSLNQEKKTLEEEIKSMEDKD